MDLLRHQSDDQLFSLQLDAFAVPDHGLTPAHAALVSTCYQISGTLGGIVTSILLDRIGYLMVAIMFSIAAPAMVIFGLPDLQFGPLT